MHQPVEQGTRTDGYHAQYQHAVEEPVAHLEPSDEMALLVREVVFEEGVASQIALVEVVDMPYEHLQQSYQGDKQQGYLVCLQRICHGDKGEENRHCELYGYRPAALPGDIMRVEQTAEREAEADAHQIKEDDVETGNPVVIFRPASGK